MSMERIATFKRGRGDAGYRQKRCFLKLRKNADRKCLFCSNVSTLLPMIVVFAEPTLTVIDWLVVGYQKHAFSKVEC